MVLSAATQFTVVSCALVFSASIWYTNKFIIESLSFFSFWLFLARIRFDYGSNNNSHFANICSAQMSEIVIVIVFVFRIHDRPTDRPTEGSNICPYAGWMSATIFVVRRVSWQHTQKLQSINCISLARYACVKHRAIQQLNANRIYSKQIAVPPNRQVQNKNWWTNTHTLTKK